MSGSSTTRFVYDGDALITELNGSNVMQRRYVHANDIDNPIMWYEGSGIGSVERHSFLKDRQGSIIAVINESGVPTAKNTYDAYGIPGSSNDGRFSYTGQAWLPEIGLMYYKARMYNPHLGCFMQIDPVGYEDQMNLYAYVANDPINHTDPTGEVLETIWDVGNVFFWRWLGRS